MDKVKGPPSVRESARHYGEGFLETLRGADGWSEDAPGFIMIELNSFVIEVLNQDFTPQSAWEYWHVVQVITLYLNHRQDKAYAARMHTRIARGMAFIQAELADQPFNDSERGSINQAWLNTYEEVKSWAKEEARE